MLSSLLVVVEWLTLLHRIRIQISARKPAILRYFVAFLSRALRIPGYILKFDDCFFQNPFKSSFTYHPFIRHYVL
jgi:hypothetical protein